MDFFIDPMSVLVITCILIYTVIEYRKRDKMHFKKVDLLNRDEIHPEHGESVAVWRLATLGIACISLLIITGYFMVIGIVHRSLIFFSVNILFLPLAAVLLLILIRDYKTYLRLQREQEAS